MALKLETEMTALQFAKNCDRLSETNIRRLVTQNLVLSVSDSGFSSVTHHSINWHAWD